MKLFSASLLAKVIPGWGKSDDFIAPWFATLEAQHKK